MTDPRRALPSVHVLLDLEGVRALEATVPRGVLTDTVREVLALVRRDASQLPADNAGWQSLIAQRVADRERPTLQAALNATGVVLHTNLGRAPLAESALQAIHDVARGFATLEYDVAAGARGSRHVHCAALLRELTGAEDAMVVNNCAAALVLALNTVADGREAIVSRGELVEIGGSFRVPDIMTRSGARLVEVGTTNRTHADDYRKALSPQTGAIVTVHRSNFTLDGFVTSVAPRTLAAIAAEANVPLVHDFGSGLMLDLAPWGLSGEPTARDAVASGASLVVMSGDKLLGGPQAGIILGARQFVEAARRNPLARALRVDKLTLAALQATLLLYRDPVRAVREVPALALLTADLASLRARAEALLSAWRAQGLEVAVVESTATVGGGAFPSARIPSVALRIGGDATSMERALRLGGLPVIARIENDALMVDLRGIPAADDARLTRAVLETLVP